MAQKLDALRGELCATMAMARARSAMRPSGRRARRFAPVYPNFSQGFGTPLLIEAKSLRDELSR